QQCSQPGAETGYYLRAAFKQDETASRALVADAWRTYVAKHLARGACPFAKEMMFFDGNQEAGAGILFPRQPTGWETVIKQEPQWLLLEASQQSMTTPVCFFPADESRRPPDWSTKPTR